MKVIDSHTGGEPTRIIIEGGPDLRKGSLVHRAERFQAEFDHIRQAVCLEPRGHDAVVGGLLCDSELPDCEFGVIFFNNAGNLGMCVHGTIGLIVTLAHLGRIGVGSHRIETPVGVVSATLDEDGLVSVVNVPSYRLAEGVGVSLPEFGEVRGDVAWGGNWFFLIQGYGPEVAMEKLSELNDFCGLVREALRTAGVKGDDGAEIDHIEVFGPPADHHDADSRNFVYCPGGAYDRSPCGTGTSGKLACLAASGRLAPGGLWRQAGILNTVFECSYEALDNGRILPSISGRAWVTGESIYHFDESDPFRYGIPNTHH